MEFLIMVDIFFNISPRTGTFLFFVNRVICFGTNCQNQIWKSNNVDILRLVWMITENAVRKRIQGGIFWQISDKLLTRFWSEYRYCINMFSAKNF